MSLNQLQKPVSPYPGEIWVYQCLAPASRVTIKAETIGTDPAAGKIDSSSGSVYLSTRRLIYVPEEAESNSCGHHVKGKGDRNFESLSIPLDRISDTHLRQPWIGPTGWVAIVAPVTDGGMDPENSMWKLELLFKDGGVYDFVEAFNKSQEARQRGQNHTEELPVYTPVDSRGANDDDIPPYV